MEQARLFDAPDGFGDDHYRHFGCGQTEVTLDLASLQHTLQLLLGDFTHVPYNPPVKPERITITVK